MSPQLRASFAARCRVGLVFSITLWTAATRVHAEPSPLLPAPRPTQLQSPGQVFRTVEPAAPNYLRATLEEVGLLGLGLAHYFANHDANSSDWDFDYDWDSFRTKISGSGYAFDTNKYDTNFITHPGSGTLYYWAARSNRLSVLESFAYAALASALWEYFGEFRERVSVNDVFVTPIAGLVLGETTLQLGAFFDRSCATPTNRWLGSVLAPFKAMHDAIDDRHPLRDTHCDRYDLSLRGAHEFRLSLSAGARIDSHASDDPMAAQSRIRLHTRVVAIDPYGGAGRGFTPFSDGNLSELWIEGGLSPGAWTDFSIRASLIPIGLHYRSLRGVGARQFGDEALFGLLIGTEYNVHRFGWNASERLDRLFVLDVPGVGMIYRRHAGALRIELELQASVSLAGIDAFALPEYVVSHASEALSSVARTHGYNYAAGFSLRPRARVIWTWFETGIDLQATQLWGIAALDRYPERASRLAVEEARQGGDGWIRVGPPHWPLRCSVSGAVLARSGSIADVRASRTELQLGAGLDAAF